MLGSGCNLLIRDEGVRGAVLRLVEPAFLEVTVDGRRVRAGTGASVSSLISQAARQGLAGLETLVGIPGTVGGALRCNAGDRLGDIGQLVRRIEVLDSHGNVQVREREELQFGYRWSNLDDPVILTAEFELDPDDADAIVKRMLKAWIVRNATQPLGFQAAGAHLQKPARPERRRPDRAGGAGPDARRRRRNQRSRSQLRRGPCGGDRAGRASSHRPGPHRVDERFNVDLELAVTVW